MVFGIVMTWITGHDDASEGSTDYELTTTTLRFFFDLGSDQNWKAAFLRRSELNEPRTPFRQRYIRYISDVRASRI